MKIALIFNGILRSIQFTINNLQEKIFQQLENENIQYDIYCHNFTVENYSNKRNNEFNINIKKENFKLLPCDYYLENKQNIIMNEINFKKYLINGHKWGNKIETAHNYILSLWSKNQITNLLKKNIENGHNYDYVIFIRSDIIFHNNFNFINLFNKIKTDYDCIIPDFHHFGGLNDRIFISKPRLALYYGNYYYEILTLINNGCKLHSETFNKLLLQKYNSNIIKEPIYFSRVRANGEIKKENFNIK
jgi:hypothetical protein